MKTYLVLTLLILGKLSLAQLNSVVYKTAPAGFGSDPEEIVIFQLLSADEMKARNINLKGGVRYNQYLKKHAAIYQGKKEFMTSEEIQAIDFSQGKNYKYIFKIQSIKGSGSYWPYSFGMYDISTGATHYANKIWMSNHSKELKKEVKFMEKSRKQNAKN